MRMSGSRAADDVHARLVHAQEHSIRAEYLSAEVARQRGLMSCLREVVADARAARTVTELAELAPQLTTRLGYDRALFSWVRDGRWVPRSAATRSDSANATAMLSAGGPPYLDTKGLLEDTVVSRRQPILVLDALDNPRVHPHLQAINHSTTYVAAPVCVGGRVEAIVHVDRNSQTGDTDEFDLDLVSSFAQSLGIELELVGSRQQAAHITADGAHPRTELLDQLTERELAVLELVAEGLTNQQIAERLFVGTETVKSHLKRLMRKLQVRTRSQAGAEYHRSLAR